MQHIRVEVTFDEILWNNAGMRVGIAPVVNVVASVADVLPMLDQHSWIVDSVRVTEYVGSDAPGRTVPDTEWFV